MWVYRVFLILWGALPIALAFSALRPVSPGEIRRFAVRYGVQETAESVSAMHKYIRLGRIGRLSGAAIGLSIHPVLYAVGLGIPNDSAYYGVIGYLLGAFLTALVPRSIGSGTRSASLSQRRLRDYLPRSALVAPMVAVAVSALAVIIYEVEPRRAIPEFSGSTVGLWVSVVAAVATFVAIRIVVARSQPVVTRPLVAVDDAMRTQTLHILNGAGMAIALLGTAACLFEMGGYAAPTWLHIVGQVAGLFALIGAVVAWMFIGASWRVPRTDLR